MMKVNNNLYVEIQIYRNSDTIELTIEKNMLELDREGLAGLIKSLEECERTWEVFRDSE